MFTLLVAAVILPADTIRGRVIDTGGQPVAQAIVEIPELGRRVTATDAGAFHMALGPGRYTLTVRRHGYAPAVREVVVDGGPTTVDIVLAPRAFRLEPVTVTATRQPLASASSPLPADALAG